MQKVGVLPDIHFTIIAGILYAAALGIFAAVSYAGEAPPEAFFAQFSPSQEETAVPRWADHRVLSVALLVVTAIIVIAFW